MSRAVWSPRAPVSPQPSVCSSRKALCTGGMCAHARTHTHTHTRAACWVFALPTLFVLTRAGTWAPSALAASSGHGPPFHRMPCLSVADGYGGGSPTCGHSAVKSPQRGFCQQILGIAGSERIICDVARRPAERAPAIAFPGNQGEHPCLAGSEGNPFICSPPPPANTGPSVFVHI